jgi:hypothetical protein
MMTKEWFSSWFDSPYYHILYKERDDKEAQLYRYNYHRIYKFSQNIILWIWPVVRASRYLSQSERV